MSFTKSAEPPEAAHVEAAGLRWLKEAEAQGGPRIAEVIAAEHGRLVIETVSADGPSSQAAAAFGQALARMHGSLLAEAEFGELPTEHPGRASAVRSG
ncbi:hypothetical protein [Nesterenkonia pannonica]|uniref:hypothetical protein n=1 Tax=Nesterenkonia pannonica TaxID=1548602 RepID=UPI0021645904|nr:hypothetical protein [Nesterenkonia pannonica]